MQFYLKLSDLRPGQKAVIDQIVGDAISKLKLQEMGLIPGTLIEVVRKTPGGGPMQIKVRGYQLALRIAEATGLLLRIA